MGLNHEMWLVALLVLVLNVMDSVTTSLCFKQYPDKELKGEANPIMRWLMLKNKVLAEVLKQGFVLGFIVWCLFGHELSTLRMATVMLGLVVLNNTYVLVSRVITKRAVASPIKSLRMLLHIPDKYTYLVALAVIFLVGIAIYNLLWR